MPKLKSRQDLGIRRKFHRKRYKKEDSDTVSKPVRTVVTERLKVVSPLSSSDSNTSDSLKIWTSEQNRRVAISMLFTYHLLLSPEEEDAITARKIRKIYPTFHMSVIHRVIKETRAAALRNKEFDGNRKKGDFSGI